MGNPYDDNLTRFESFGAEIDRGVEAQRKRTASVDTLAGIPPDGDLSTVLNAVRQDNFLAATERLRRLRETDTPAPRAAPKGPEIIDGDYTVVTAEQSQKEKSDDA